MQIEVTPFFYGCETAIYDIPYQIKLNMDIKPITTNTYLQR